MGWVGWEWEGWGWEGWGWEGWGTEKKKCMCQCSYLTESSHAECISSKFLLLLFTGIGQTGVLQCRIDPEQSSKTLTTLKHTQQVMLGSVACKQHKLWTQSSMAGNRLAQETIPKWYRVETDEILVSGFGKQNSGWFPTKQTQ